jgi:hypothetical protein
MISSIAIWVDLKIKLLLINMSAQAVLHAAGQSALRHNHSYGTIGRTICEGIPGEQ